MPINADWHHAHVLGKNAPMDKRIAWHEEHLRECGCRKELPVGVAKAIAEREAAAAASGGVAEPPVRRA